MAEVNLYNKLNSNGVANTYWTAWGHTAEDSTLLEHANHPRLAASFPRPTIDPLTEFTAALNFNGKDSWFGEFADGATLGFSGTPAVGDIKAASYPYAPPGSVSDSAAYELSEPEFGKLVTLAYPLPGSTAGAAGSAPGDFAGSTPLSPNWGHWRTVGGETI